MVNPSLELTARSQPVATSRVAFSTQTGDKTLTADHRQIIARVVRSVCRRHQLNSSDAEEFAAIVNLRLLEDNYRVIREFQGRSSLATYLAVVIHRLFLDCRNGEWGKWRPSAEAKRLGRVAILFEQLTRRDGWTFDEAVMCLQTNYGVEATWQELYELSTKLPHGEFRRRTVPEFQAWSVASSDPGPDERVFTTNQRFKTRQVRSALKRAVTTLTAEERVLLRLRFQQGLSVASVARTLNLNQRKLYVRFDQLFRRLRLALENYGVSGSDVETMLAEPEALASSGSETRSVAGLPS